MDKKQARPETSGKSSPARVGASYGDQSVASVEETLTDASITRATVDAQRLLPADVLMLQRTVGNRAVANLLGRNGTAPAQAAPIQRTREGDAAIQRVSNVPQVQRAGLAPDVVQRRLAANAVVSAVGKEPDVEALTLADLRDRINGNLDSVTSPAVTEAPRSGEFNNGEAGKENGTKITVDPPAQNLPNSITAANANYGLTRHVVANMMLPRDGEHRVGMNAVADALATRGTADPRWTGLNFQGKDLFLTLSETLTVVTAYRKSWSEQQALAYDRFNDPEKYARLEEEERQKRQAVKAATKERDDTLKNANATIDRLVGVAKGNNTSYKSISKNEISYYKLGPLLQGDDVADLALVTNELASIFASKEKKKAPKSAGGKNNGKAKKGKK